ncbi:MAG: DUF4347 domain-containing protein [Pyrinomonadaceae bacterium]|jgi:hypothetical protein|nr:DUF4347 domain-containing protein [Blastocatellia bacterium]MCW5955668.1 DUF4347 domain-containing protein [Pyrinomonadaceae bacterium]
MEFDVVDTTDPKLVQTVTDLETRGKSIVLSYCAMSNGLNQMVDDIMRRSEFGKVKVLRIWAHGTPSVIGISSGTDPRLIRVHLTGISPGALSSPYHRLADLKPYFAQNARIELRGCQVGAGSDAEKIMRQIADMLNVDVHAPVDDQAITGLDWYGPVMIAKPGRTDVIRGSGEAVK